SCRCSTASAAGCSGCAWPATSTGSTRADRPARKLSTPTPAAGGSSGAPNPTPPPTERAGAPAADQVQTIPVGITTVISDAAFFAAEDRGYFQRQGLAVELQRSATPLT